MEAPREGRPGAGSRGRSAGRASAHDLRAELERFGEELQISGLRASTVHSYLMGSRLFVRWLAGEYSPGRGRGR